MIAQPSPSLGSVDPKDLTRGERAALAAVCTFRALRRARAGWQCPGSQKVSLAMAASLVRRGLARTEYAGGQQQLIATGSGRATHGVAQVRTTRRG